MCLNARQNEFSHEDHGLTTQIIISPIIACIEQLAERTSTKAIEHPQGKIYVDAKVDDIKGEVEVKQATLVRHARRPVAGAVSVPGTILSSLN